MKTLQQHVIDYVLNDITNSFIALNTLPNEDLYVYRQIYTGLLIKLSNIDENYLIDVIRSNPPDTERKRNLYINLIEYRTDITESTIRVLISTSLSLETSITREEILKILYLHHPWDVLTIHYLLSQFDDRPYIRTLLRARLLKLPLYLSKQTISTSPDPGYIMLPSNASVHIMRLIISYKSFLLGNPTGEQLLIKTISDDVIIYMNIVTKPYLLTEPTIHFDPDVVNVIKLLINYISEVV
jgi:hypothetical protein